MITVRRACAEDSDAIWRIFQDEASYSGTLQLPHPSRDVWRKRVSELPEGDFMRQFGFEVEGTHRGYSLRDGRYVDTHSMARLRPK